MKRKKKMYFLLVRLPVLMLSLPTVPVYTQVWEYWTFNGAVNRIPNWRSGPLTSTKCFPTCWSRRWGGSRLLPFRCLHGHTPNKRVIHTHQDVLWLDVCVDDFTFRVEIVQTLQDLRTHGDEQTQIVLFKTHKSYSRLKKRPELFPSFLSFLPSFFLRMLVFLWGRKTRLLMFCFSGFVICFCPEAAGLKQSAVSFNLYSSSAWLSGGWQELRATSHAHHVAEGKRPPVS